MKTVLTEKRLRTLDRTNIIDFSPEGNHKVERGVAPSTFTRHLHLGVNCWCLFNSLAPGKFQWNFIYVIFKRILVIDDWGIYREIALIWRSLDFTNDQSTQVQVMAWCHQATSHYLSQCWPSSMSPYGITRPQWVNKSIWESIVQISLACQASMVSH